MMVAGGAGADTITINYGMGQDTRVLWGGDDAAMDVFDFVYSGDNSAVSRMLGILVATVTGLTDASFASFSLSMLNLPASFDWGSIDAVILNPDSQDKLTMWGSAIDASPFENALYGVTAMHMNSQDIWDDIGVVWSATSPSATEGQSTFLGTSLHMQAQDWDEIGTDWYRKATDGGTSILDGGESNDQAIDEFLATHRSPDATWTINMSNYDPMETVSDWFGITRPNGTVNRENIHNGSSLGALSGNSPSYLLMRQMPHCLAMRAMPWNGCWPDAPIRRTATLQQAFTPFVLNQ